MSDVSQEKRRRWLRFSLRSLVLLVLLIASAIGLWWRRGAWVAEVGDGPFDKSIIQQGEREYPSWSPDGTRQIIRYESWRTGSNSGGITGFHISDTKGVELLDLGSYGDVPQEYWWHSNDRIIGVWLSENDPESIQSVIWHRRRPEWWYGIFWLWETWAVMVFGLWLIYSLYRDRRRFREAKVEG